ncbi:MAG: GatB/YqeY domain-containing protein [Clostridiales bacterium]|nr:GatB/YqeY domain-containing protein [Clostridiales bacterium]
MALKERLLDDMKSAMKDKNIVRKNTVQMVRTAILQVEKDKKIVLDDEGVMDVIAKELKSRKDSLPEYEKSGREDLIDNLKKEIDILLEYMPKQLSREELYDIVKGEIEVCGAVSMKDIGKVMQLVLPKVKGRAQGKEINEIVKEILGC